MNGGVENIDRAVSEDIEQIEDARADALATLENAQNQWQALLEWEAHRLRRKQQEETQPGGDGSRLQRLDTRLQSSLRQIDALAVERERVRIRVPVVPEGGAVVHGRVTDGADRGIEDLVVRLVDREGVPVREEANASTTDGAGAFAVTLRAESLDRLGQQENPELFLGVFDGKCHLLYRHCVPLGLSAGARVEENLRLDRDELRAGGSAG